MRVIRGLCVSLFCCALFVSPCWAASEPLSALQTDLLNAVQSGEYDDLTVGQLRELLEKQHAQTCAPQCENLEEPLITRSVVDQRLTSENLASRLPFSIIPHKRNYLLPVTYNSHVNSEPFEVDDEDMDRFEVKFQFSFKVPVWQNVIGNADLWAAYTNLSFWQAYNQPFSSPFRETNHEPELFLTIENDTKIFGLTNSLILIGLNHQSNGQGGTLSRSWNRLYLNFILDRDDFVLSFSPWYRFEEDRDDDDNPDIDKYLGYGEIKFGYKWDQHVFSVMLRNNLRQHGNKGAVQVDWTFPLTSQLKGYVQYFNGYGESLIDYNASSNRIGFGVVLSDLF
ncbi:phospholipase A [uncultured Desulfuromonas sp.]|uniref:phospholipase A n=1 Tax=uncultured Desulfuromonas sp. TaxID=181013 RepID=UPI002AAB5894|nr:phospholipase A [uncultured Desulfuromonas sp.]